MKIASVCWRFSKFCTVKPDSVESSHVSGIIVANYLKRFFVLRRHDLARR